MNIHACKIFCYLYQHAGAFKVFCYLPSHICIFKVFLLNLHTCILKVFWLPKIAHMHIRVFLIPIHTQISWGILATHTIRCYISCLFKCFFCYLNLHANSSIFFLLTKIAFKSKRYLCKVFLYITCNIYIYIFLWDILTTQKLHVHKSKHLATISKGVNCCGWSIREFWKAWFPCYEKPYKRRL